MSGHSKWATTKHKKAIIDSRRAKNFAKLIKELRFRLVLVEQMFLVTQPCLTLLPKPRKALYLQIILSALLNVVQVLKLAVKSGKPLCMKVMAQVEWLF